MSTGTRVHMYVKALGSAWVFGHTYSRTTRMRPRFSKEIFASQAHALSNPLKPHMHCTGAACLLHVSSMRAAYTPHGATSMLQEAIDTQLPHSYTMAFAFATREEAMQTCRSSGLKASKLHFGMRKLTVSLLSPADLGWTKNGAGQFRQRVAKLMEMAADDIQTVIVCAIPTTAIELAGCVDAEKFVIQESIDHLKLLQPVHADADDAEYSCAHIAKIYELEPAEVIEVRMKLAEVRAGDCGSIGDPADLECTIQSLLVEAQGSDKHHQCAKCRNELLPNAEFCLKCGKPAHEVVRL